MYAPRQMIRVKSYGRIESTWARRLGCKSFGKSIRPGDNKREATHLTKPFRQVRIASKARPSTTSNTSLFLHRCRDFQALNPTALQIFHAATSDQVMNSTTWTRTLKRKDHAGWCAHVLIARNSDFASPGRRSGSNLWQVWIKSLFLWPDSSRQQPSGVKMEQRMRNWHNSFEKFEVLETLIGLSNNYRL